jgi:hypothetical protein
VRYALALIALTAAAVAAGCGGDGGGGERLTKEQYALQANTICRDFKADLDALGPEPTMIEQIGPYAERAKPIFDAHLDQLKELTPPEELEDAVDRWLETGDAARARLDDLEAAAEDGDAQRLQELAAEAEREDRESDALARQIGATTCAEI